MSKACLKHKIFFENWEALKFKDAKLFKEFRECKKCGKIIPKPVMDKFWESLK